MAFKEITITKTKGQHSTDAMLSVQAIVKAVDKFMGFVLKVPSNKTVFFAGDTLWHEYIEYALKKHNPDIIVLNIGEAKIKGFDGSLIMSTEDVKRYYEELKQTKNITVYIDVINHWV